MATRHPKSRSAKRLPKHLAGDRFTERDYQAYAMAIGQLALAWNDLHEKLGLIFVTMFDEIIYPDPDDYDEDLKSVWASVWSSSTIDRLKREMLKSAISEIEDLELLNFPKLKDDVVWVLNQADRLEDARNNAVHSPLLLLAARGSIFEGMFPNVIPNPMLSNKRAVRLIRSQRELLDEFRWCRDATLELRDFALRIKLALTVENYVWPDRPRLPSRGKQD